MTDETWRTSTYSGSEGNCVQVGNVSGTVAVRDTKNRDSVTLTVGAEAWKTFTEGLK
jgi:hypothetical protein